MIKSSCSFRAFRKYIENNLRKVGNVYTAFPENFSVADITNQEDRLKHDEYLKALSSSVLDGESVDVVSWLPVVEREWFCDYDVWMDEDDSILRYGIYTTPFDVKMPEMGKHNEDLLGIEFRGDKILWYLSKGDIIVFTNKYCEIYEELGGAYKELILYNNHRFKKYVGGVCFVS